MDYIVALRDATPQEGLIQLDGDTSMSPGTFEAAFARRRRRDPCRRRSFGEKSRQRLCRHPAARPSCRDRAADGFLPVRQCRHRRAPCAKPSRHRARRDRRFRRASRQRLAGDFLGRQDGDVLLDPSDAAVSRHRRGQRERRIQYRRQCAAASRRRRREIPRCLREQNPAAAHRIQPELVIISAGFDAHNRDPLANINLTEEDFAWATQKLMDVADRCAGGRVVSLLEGGYDLQALGNSVAAHVTALMRG